MPRLSRREVALLDLLSAKEQTVREISELYFEGDVPFEGANRIALSLRRLTEKINNSDVKHEIIKGDLESDKRTTTYKIRRRRKK